MLKKYTLEDYWKLYEDLPEKIQDLFWEEDLGKRVEKISERFNLSEETSLLLVEIVAQLFLGVLSPSYINKTIEEEFSFPENVSEKITNEIVRFIIYPTQHLLREIYKEEEFNKIGVKKGFVPKKEERSSFGDTYREPIE